MRLELLHHATVSMIHEVGCALPCPPLYPVVGNVVTHDMAFSWCSTHGWIDRWESLCRCRLFCTSFSLSMSPFSSFLSCTFRIPKQFHREADGLFYSHQPEGSMFVVVVLGSVSSVKQNSHPWTLSLYMTENREKASGGGDVLSRMFGQGKGGDWREKMEGEQQRLLGNLNSRTHSIQMNIRLPWVSVFSSVKRRDHSLIIREMQIKTMRCHLAPIWPVRPKQTSKCPPHQTKTEIKCWQSNVETGILLSCWWEERYKMFQPLEGKSLKQLK